jgi:hypothetical protein
VQPDAVVVLAGDGEFGAQGGRVARQTLWQDS